MKSIQSAIGDNLIIGAPVCSENSVVFKPGTKGNILYCEDNLDLTQCKITFNGNHSLVFLFGSKHRYHLNVAIHQDSVLYIGRDNYFNSVVNLVLSERKHIFIGDNGLFSFGIWMRTADPHLVYSCDTHKRINPSKNILIGDHVWIGQETVILKGSRICSGSIIGAHSTVSGKLIPSNQSWGGSPVKKIAEKVFFDSSCVHNWTKKQTKAARVYASDEWDYTDTQVTVPAKGLFKQLDELQTASARLDFILSNPAVLQGKYRFAAKDKSKPQKETGFKAFLIRIYKAVKRRLK